MSAVVRHLPTVILLLALASSSPLQAQSADARQRPGRDRSSLVRRTGTASITGRVVAGDTGRPLARARVTAAAPDLADGGISTFTDQAGGFVLSQLPAGSYTITASKASFVTMAYGAQRPGRRGRRLTLAQGQQAREIDIRLPRGSAITGRVYDENGEPIVGATVQALRYQYPQGEPRLVGSALAQTDDRGVYRIYGLNPGNYVVAAAARMESLRDWEAAGGESAPAQSYAPTYYPGVVSAADASPVVLGVQAEYSNVDFVLQGVPTARVSGSVVSESGAGGRAMVVLVADDPAGVTAGTTYAARVLDDGTFTVGGVAPGKYLAVARTGGAGVAERGGRTVGAGGRAGMVGVQPVTVAGQDVAGVTIVAGGGGALAGWVTWESGSGQRPDLSQLRISTSPATALPMVPTESARLQPDGSFTIPNVVAGSHMVRVSNLPTGWALRGVTSGGRDITDQWLEVRNGQTLAGVQVVLTDRVTTITGSVEASPEDRSDCYVIAFPADPGQWRARSRRVRGVRCDEKGVYTITGLPPGDYYLAAATDLEPGSWFDPSLLAELQKTAARVSVEEGETKTAPLRVASNAQ